MRRFTLLLALLLVGCTARQSPPLPGPQPQPPPASVPAAVTCGGEGTDSGGDPVSGLPTTAAAGPTGGVQWLHTTADGLLAGAYDRLFHSRDGGRTWVEIPAPAAPFGFSDAAYAPDGTLYAASLDGQLERSSDQGATWQPVAAVPRASAILVLGRTILVAGRRVPPGGQPLPAVYRSDDGGQTWSVSSEGFWPGRAEAVARDAANPDVLYAGVGQYDLAQHGGGLFKSTDGGRSWQQASDGLPGWPLQVLADPVQGGRVYARTTEGLYRSDDGAATWQPVPGQFWYAAPDAVKAWQGSAEGLPVQALAYDPAARRLVAASEAGLLVEGETAGAWTPAGAGLPGLVLSFTPPYAIAGRALFRDGHLAGALPADRMLLAVSPTDPQHLWAVPPMKPGQSATPGPALYESRDGGRTWDGLPPGPPLTGPVFAADDQTLIARAVPDPVRSSDGGRTWQPLTDLPATDLVRGAGGRIWAASDRGAYHSEDGGRTWHWSGLGLPSLNVRQVSPDPNDARQVVALTEAGVACSADGGATWQGAGPGLPAPPYRGPARLARSPDGRLFAAFEAAGVYAATTHGWVPLEMPVPKGLRDLAAPAGDRVAVSELLSTDHRRLAAPLPPARLPVTPGPGGGPHWQAPAMDGTPVRSLLVSSADPTVALAVTAAGVLRLTRDGGRTWTPAGSMDRGIVPATGDVSVPSGRYGDSSGGAIYQTADGGRSWEQIALRLPGNPETEGIRLSPDPRDPSVLVGVFQNPLIMGGGSGILRSVDGGKSWIGVWTPARQPGQPLQRVGRLLRSPADPDRLYASGDTILVSRDGGRTWQQQGEGAIYSVGPDGTLYGWVGYRLARSSDGGATWHPVSLPGGAEPAGAQLQADPGGAGRLFLLNSNRGGLWVSRDAGDTWTHLTAGIGDPPVSALTPAGPGAWYVSCSSGLLFRLELN